MVDKSGRPQVASVFWVSLYNVRMNAAEHGIVHFYGTRSLLNLPLGPILNHFISVNVHSSFLIPHTLLGLVPHTKIHSHLPLRATRPNCFIPLGFKAVIIL